MNLKLHEVITLYYELNGLSRNENGSTEVILDGILKQKMSLKVKMYLQRLNKIVTEEFKLYEENRNELVKRYGKQEGEGVYNLRDGNFEQYTKEFNELVDTGVHINVDNLWSSDLTIDNLESIETNEYYPILFKLIDK
jgi:hypothetical protein